MGLITQLDALAREEAGPYASQVLLQYGLRTQQAISSWIAAVNAPVQIPALTRVSFPAYYAAYAYLSGTDQTEEKAAALAKLQHEIKNLTKEVRVWLRQILIFKEQGEALHSQLEHLILGAKVHHQHPLWKQRPALYQEWCARIQLLTDFLRILEAKIADLTRQATDLRKLLGDS